MWTGRGLPARWFRTVCHEMQQVRRWPVALVGVLAVFALLGPATASETKAPVGQGAAGRTRVVVYKLEAQDDLAALAAQLDDEVVLQLGRQAELEVVGEGEIAVLLSHEEDRVALQCEDPAACSAKLSAAIDADRILTGHIGRIGEMIVVSLKLLDARKGLVTGGETAEAADAEGLGPEVRAALERLFGAGGDAAGPVYKLDLSSRGAKMAVIDLTAHDVSPGLAANLTQLLSLELKKYEGVSVISRSEIEAMLQFETERMALECTSDISCLAEIGGALGVDYLVGGSVGKLGDALVVTLKLMDVQAARVVSRASQSFRGDETDLVPALRFAAGSLLGRPPAGVGTLSLNVNIDEGQLTVDGRTLLRYPQERRLEGLKAGKHSVSVEAEGFVTGYRETFVIPDRRTDLRMELEALPKPWYKQWWPWTIIGAVVVGGVVTTVVLTQPDAPSSGTVEVTVQ